MKLYQQVVCDVTIQVGSTILAQAAGVPTLPWSGSDVSLSYKECKGSIPGDVYQRACLHSVEETLACCNTIQYPCMLKASWGGGGKGIRKVHSHTAARLLEKMSRWVDLSASTLGM